MITSYKGCYKGLHPRGDPAVQLYQSYCPGPVAGSWIGTHGGAYVILYGSVLYRTRYPLVNVVQGLHLSGCKDNAASFGFTGPPVPVTAR
eukprot:277814-Pyramimonas_sp.AAC.1